MTPQPPPRCPPTGHSRGRRAGPMTHREMDTQTIGSPETEARLSTPGSHEDSRVLVASDDPNATTGLANLLSDNGYHCTVVDDVVEARAFLAQDDFALVLMDMELPGLGGLALVLEITENYPNSAVFLLTQLDDPALVTNALEIGAYGYMVKPLDPNQILIDVTNALHRRSVEKKHRSETDELRTLVRARAKDLRDAKARLERAERELLSSREETIERLSIAAEFRDNETIKHIKRMSGYCEILARGSGLDAEHCEMIRIASKLHDVGKIGLPDHILTKHGPLSDEERAIMQEHTENGYRILAGSNSEVLSIAASIALTHHERFDGKGYPRGLSGETIPLEGRIVAVADVFDGLTSERVYKKAVPLEAAVSIMRGESDRQLDGDLVDLFLSSMDFILPVRDQFKDR